MGSGGKRFDYFQRVQKACVLACLLACLRQTLPLVCTARAPQLHRPLAGPRPRPALAPFFALLRPAAAHTRSATLESECGSGCTAAPVREAREPASRSSSRTASIKHASPAERCNPICFRHAITRISFCHIICSTLACFIIRFVNIRNIGPCQDLSQNMTLAAEKKVTAVAARKARSPSISGRRPAQGGALHGRVQRGK